MESKHLEENMIITRHHCGFAGTLFPVENVKLCCTLELPGELLILLMPKLHSILVSSAYLRLLIFLPILIPACASSSLAFHMMYLVGYHPQGRKESDTTEQLHFYSAYKLNKQSDNIQPRHTLLPILKQSVVPCLVLTVAS